MEDGRFKSPDTGQTYVADNPRHGLREVKKHDLRNGRPYGYLRERMIFLQEFLKHPQQVGSVIPSSRFVERRVIELAQVRTSRTVVELGGGTGGITQALLRALPGSSRLMCVEINQQFCQMLRRIPDQRLVVHHGDAWDLQRAIDLHGLHAPDAIVSGIPFSTMPRPVAVRILEAITTALAPGGRFLAYQVSGQVEALARPILGPAQVEVEFFNVPPVRLYRWGKHAA
jgi:phospholipid N-methyltransferase